MKPWMIMLSAILLVSCGSSTSVNGILFGKGSSADRYDALYDKARMEYDRGEYANAGLTLDSILNRYPASVDAAELRSYAYLGEAGLSFFDIVKVIALSASDAADLEDGKVKTCITKNTEAISKLSCMLDVDISSLSSTGKTIADIRASNPALVKINNAIKMLCPYAASAIKVTGDARHTCTTIRGVNSTVGGKGVFMWALLHLLEGSALNQEVTRLQAVASSLSASASASNLASSIEILSKAVAATVTTTSGENIITALDNDLSAVANAIANLPGVPSSVSTSIKTIKEKLAQAGTGTTSSSTSGLLATVTSKTKDVAKTTIIAKASEINSATPEQKSQICSSYAAMGGSTADLTGVNCP